MPFHTRLRVRFSECDKYGHINHATYLQYMETARVLLLREIGAPLADLRGRGISLVIRRITIEYRRPGFLDEELDVVTEVLRLRGSSGTFRQVVSRGAEILAEAMVEWAAVGDDGLPARLPPEMRSLQTVTREAAT